MSLLALSQEVIVHILSFMHYIDLNACRRVNHAFNRLIQGSSLLQYSMQLQLAGYEDNPHSHLVISDKLKLLLQQEFAWCRLQFDKPSSIRLPFNPSSIYDLTDGILLLGESQSGIQSGADYIRWTRLSSLVSSPQKAELWEKIDVGAHIIDVGLAVQEHDLIVVAIDRETEDQQTNFELRLIQLSTGLSHPLASKPTIPLATIPSPFQELVGQCSVCIEIVGDLLCFLFHYPAGSTKPPAMFEVYNWKSGKCLQIRCLDCSTFATFTFLRPDIIVLPNCTDNAIELCRVGDVPDEGCSPLPLKTLCILRLPQFHHGHSIAQLTCRSEPKMTASRKTAAAFRPPEPFCLNPENAIVIFNLMTHDIHGFHECLTLIVHASALLSALAVRLPQPPPAPSLHQSLPESDSGNALLLNGLPKIDDELRIEGLEDSPARVPWTHWGPRTCRWLETSFGASRWVTTTCGQRYVTVEEDAGEDDSSRTTIVVYDFNPNTVHRLVSRFRRKRRRLRGNNWDITVPEGEVVAGSGVPAAAMYTYTRPEDVALIPFSDPDTRVIGQIQCEATELMAGYPLDNRLFNESVRSGLPFAQLSTYETYGYGAVLLSRNVIIGVKINDTEDIRELVIHPIKTRP